LHFYENIDLFVRLSQAQIFLVEETFCTPGVDFFPKFPAIFEDLFILVLAAFGNSCVTSLADLS
jgi:hypothetical protein